MERMFDFCDHVVVNPVLGPKKAVCNDRGESVFGDFFTSRLGGRMFAPFFKHVLRYPREAASCQTRRNTGFTHFSVGRIMLVPIFKTQSRTKIASR